MDEVPQNQCHVSPEMALGAVLLRSTCSDTLGTFLRSCSQIFTRNEMLRIMSKGEPRAPAVSEVTGDKREKRRIKNGQRAEFSSHTAPTVGSLFIHKY